MLLGRKDLLIGGVLLILISVVSIWGLYQFSVIFSASDSSVKASIIAGSIALATLVLTFIRDRNKALKESHREKKVEIYRKFVRLALGMVDKSVGDKDFDPTVDSAFLAEWMELRQEIIFYASPEVINALAEFTKVGTGSEGQDAVRKVGRAFLAMREDIGLRNRGLDELNIHQLYITEDLSKMVR